MTVGVAMTALVSMLTSSTTCKFTSASYYTIHTKVCSHLICSRNYCLYTFIQHFSTFTDSCTFTQRFSTFTDSCTCIQRFSTFTDS